MARRKQPSPNKRAGCPGHRQAVHSYLDDTPRLMLNNRQAKAVVHVLECEQPRCRQARSRFRREASDVHRHLQHVIGVLAGRS